MKLTIKTSYTRLWPWFLLIMTLIGLDQLSKLLAEAYLQMYQPRPVFPSLNLSLVYNPGAAFSLLSEAGGWQRWFFLALSLCISLVLMVWLTRLKAEEKWTRPALSLILAGAIGNLIDRALHGYVIDFIDFYYPAANGCLPLFVAAGESCHWPTFNIADSAISVGAACLLLGLIFEGSQKQGSVNN
jgi:signal peptidase II